MYERLCAGKTLNKSEEALRFGIDERSVQRDIDDIRAYLAERSISSGDDRQVVYDRQKKGFLLSGYQSPLMTNTRKQRALPRPPSRGLLRLCGVRPAVLA